MTYLGANQGVFEKVKAKGSGNMNEKGESNVKYVECAS